MEDFLRNYSKFKYSENKSQTPTQPKAPDPTDVEGLLKRKRKKDELKHEESIPDKPHEILKKKRADERQMRLQGVMSQDPLMPQDRSIFAPDPETATTTVILAPSFSGKTTLIVENLNMLTDSELDSYTTITLCTTSVGADPLKNLEDRILRKMSIFDCFMPDYIALLKKSNNLTGNRFRYLVIMDDCIRLRGETIVNMVLTLRNSGVSTVISIQYSRLLTPGQRQSIHDYYLMNLRLEDLEYLLTGFIATHMRDRLNEEGDPKAYDYSIKKLAEAVRYRLKDHRVLHYDQRHDKIAIYQTASRDD